MYRHLRLAATFAIACITTAAIADPPPIGTSPRLTTGFDQPGSFPTTVTAANISMRPQVGAELDGANEDIIETIFGAAGPIRWTSSRVNSGDVSLSIGPANPASPLYYPPATFTNNFQAGNTAPADPINTTNNDLSTLAWRANINTGGLLASVRHNGGSNGYVVPGTSTSVGNVYGSAYFSAGGGQGWGFRMNDGVFDNGGNGSSDLVIGATGAAGGRHEMVVDTSVAYFPYEQGWTGAWVTGAIGGQATYAARSTDVADDAVFYFNGVADVLLAGVNSATDGMLFVAPSEGSSATKIAASYINGTGGWNVAVRADDDADTSGNTVLQGGNHFQFVYVPYTARNLVGGHINGDTGAALQSAGDALFDLTRTAAGQYSLSVYEADGVTKKNESDGMLIMSVVDTVAGNPLLPSRAFMSYDYDTASGNFLVRTREVLATTGGTDDAFGNDFNLVDTDFYFAWVDFENPLTLSTPLTGDANNDGVVDVFDFDAISQNFGAAGLPSDGLGLGDANDDGVVDVFDFDSVSQNFGNVAALGAGAVPEPTSLLLATLALGGAIAFRRLR